jgi:mono/diheme cytochrome c family protein
MRTLIATVIGVAVMAGAAGAQTLDPKKVDAGQKVYVAQKCSTCHAIKNSGGKMASALGGVGAKLNEADIKKWLTDTAAMEAKVTPKPKVSMASYMKTHKIADGDLDTLVAFLMSQK